MLSTQPAARTGRPMAAASIARRLSALSAFYDYGIGVDVLGFSPVANVRRPKLSDDSTTVGLSAAELVALLDAAEAHSPRFAALVSLLAYNGVRIDEALSADVGALGPPLGGNELLLRVGAASATSARPPAWLAASSARAATCSASLMASRAAA